MAKYALDFLRKYQLSNRLNGNHRGNETYARGLLFIVTILALLSTSTAQTPDLTALSSEIKELLPNDKAGALIGLVNGTEETVVVVGNSSLSENTLFEYGSLTKVFTAILLQQLADEGALSLDDRVEQYLPSDVNAGQWQGVSLKHLATHTAGIPSLPPNLNPVAVWLLGRNDDPFARYDEAKLYKGVESTKIEGAGEIWTYSNFGFALLGQVLTNASGQSYEALVQTRILEPLAMETASTTFSHADVAPPLKANGTNGSRMFFNAIAPAGALKGSVTDALQFLRAAMQACTRDDALSVALCKSTQATDIKANETETQSLGWLRSAQSNHDVVWHNGGTRGYRSFLGFVPETNQGVVVLMNVAEVDVTKPALDFLNSLE